MPEVEGRTFVEKGSATAATATATKAAATGSQHRIQSVSASFSGAAALAAAALCQVKDGTTVIDEFYVGLQPGVVTIFYPYHRCTPGNAVSAELASGGTGIVGKVSIRGDTI